MSIFLSNTETTNSVLDLVKIYADNDGLPPVDQTVYCAEQTKDQQLLWQMMIVLSNFRNGNLSISKKMVLCYSICLNRRFAHSLDRSNTS